MLVEKRRTIDQGDHRRRRARSPSNAAAPSTPIDAGSGTAADPNCDAIVADGLVPIGAPCVLNALSINV